MNSYTKGRKGEEIARYYLLENGYEIIANNFKSYKGEIDIIAYQKDTVVFVEVKSWNTLGIENIEYSINREKKKRIILTSKYFLHNNPEYSEKRLRYDVIFLNSSSEKVFHYKNAFMGDF